MRIGGVLSRIRRRPGCGGKAGLERIERGAFLAAQGGDNGGQLVPLCQLSAEQDFMLGTLLGYDREQQCRRYLGKLDISLPTLVAMAAQPGRL
jgi:hypothetical protein